MSEKLLHLFFQDSDIHVLSAVISAFKLADEVNASEKSLCKILTYGKEIYEIAGNVKIPHWPITRHKAENLLQTVGYVPPTKYLACLNENHKNQAFLYEQTQDVCPSCQENKFVPVYYNQIRSKINLMCKNESMCKKITAHWDQKDHWIGRHGQPFFPIKEIWDGTRFAELQWFWNPNEEWLLPAFCTNCKSVISAASISTAAIGANGKMVICQACAFENAVKEEFARGDPRNIAFMLHWDGFQPFGESEKHSTGIKYRRITFRKIKIFKLAFFKIKNMHEY